MERCLLFLWLKVLCTVTVYHLADSLNSVNSPIMILREIHADEVAVLLTELGTRSHGNTCLCAAEFCKLEDIHF